METTISSLTDLDAAVVAQQQALAAQLLQEKYPLLELRRGVLFDTVLAPHAMFAAAHQANYDLLRQSMSFQAVLADPDSADDALVDALASNYLIARRAGQYAHGYLLVLLSQNVGVTIAAGTVFTALGQHFTASASFAARTASAAIIASTDRLLTAQPDGTYGFIIDVMATDEGSANIVKDTLFVPSALLPYFVKAYAVADFVDGTSTETNAELAARMATGAAAKAFSGRLQMSASLRAAYPAIVSDTVIGFGDSEMIRDRHSIFPGSIGGRADWYVRTQQTAQRSTATKTATLVGRDATTGKGVWQISFDRDDAPGMYDIVQIQGPTTPGLGTYTVLSETFGLDATELASDILVPDLETAEEATYSRFSTRVVQFVDTDTALTGLTIGSSQQDYTVTTRCMPLIDELQAFASARGRQNYGGDVLVKAAIPCFLRVSLTLYVPTGVATPDTAVIQQALAAAVSRFDFTGQLSAASLAGVVYSTFSTAQKGVYISAIDMFGQIRKPDQTIQYVRATDILRIPTDGMTSPRTVAFLLEPEDVAVTTAVADIPA